MKKRIKTAFSPASRLSRESLRGAEGTASPGAAGWVGWQRWAGGGAHLPCLLQLSQFSNSPSALGPGAL